MRILFILVSRGSSSGKVICRLISTIINFIERLNWDEV